MSLVSLFGSGIETTSFATGFSEGSFFGNAGISLGDSAVGAGFAGRA